MHWYLFIVAHLLWISGMGYRPLSANIDSEMIISYDSKNETDMNFWIKRIDTFLESKSLFKKKMITIYIHNLG